MKKIALVSGATGGIGFQISKQLAQQGFFVFGTTFSNTSEKVDSWNAALGENGCLKQVDICDIEQCSNFVREAATEGELSVLVNNAGITDDAFFLKMTPQQWAKVINTNLLSLYNLTHPVFTIMCEQGKGKIINISSVNAQKGQAGQTNYSASKAGIHGFTKALSQEGARYNVNVNTVSPGYTDTDMIRKIKPQIQEAIKATIPLKRFAETEDVANTVCFLASNNADYITGADLSVNGGMHIS
ncbi:3-oxoacyl-ACP reductase [Litorilituus lipolyticus]|uniref:SDR family oxidoreductase n=1 Tax=Litorilituus lipolyticus TaxID=2491017 RepID=A0A502L4V4_9GAMM|nr:3-oxoacyl-ACP reductase [Litorilituus lipolyticus]TPH18948.1 SDR family oxidoreductase [Litorilituus lipolyticus]